MTRIGLVTDGPPDFAGTASLRRALTPLGEVRHFHANAALGDALLAWTPDIAVLAPHDGTRHATHRHAVGALEAQGVPFTGGGSSTLSHTASRPRLKAALGEHQVPTPVYTVVHEPAQLAPLGRRSFPLAIFRDHDTADASAAVVVDDPEALEREARDRWANGEAPLLVERHLTGEAFACVVLGNGKERVVLPPVTRGGDGAHVELLPTGLREAVDEVVLAACRALDLRDLARVDVALTDTGVPQVVAVDPLPALDGTEPHLVRLAAAAVGIVEDELAQRWLLHAAARAGVAVPAAPAFSTVRRFTPPRGGRAIGRRT